MNQAGAGSDRSRIYEGLKSKFPVARLAQRLLRSLPELRRQKSRGIDLS